MRNFLLRLSLAAAVTASMLAISSPANAQQSTPDAQQPTTSAPTAAQPQSNDMQAQEAKPFSGTIVKEKGKLVLKDTATNTSYQLDDQDKAKQFEGKSVKVTGKLNANGNVIHVENIEASGA